MKHVNHIKYSIVVGLFCVVPSLVFAQKPVVKTEESETRSVIKINKLDVIYQGEEDYSGIVIDNHPASQEDENTLYEKPFLVSPPPPKEDIEEERPQMYQMMDDVGAESEDEILYASFDSDVIHYPKLDISKMDSVHIHLVDHSKGMEFSYPTPEISRPTSHYGPRRNRFHYGVDLAMPTGQPIYSAFDGVVRISKYNSSYGNLVVVRHQNGLETYYAHMSKRLVRPGDPVKAGETLGLCGNTGRSYGSHLHFEIRYMGNAMNPENVIDCAKRQLISEELVLTPKSFRKVSKYSSSKGTYTSGNKQYYKVRSGDTLGHIARRNGTTVRRLCQLNGIKETTILQIGRRLRIR